MSRVSSPDDVAPAAALLPDLPLEILMQIFETTASMSVHSAAAIALVSSWSHKLMLPYLFRTIIHRTAPFTPAQLITASRSSSRNITSRSTLPPHLGRYVRNLWTESIGIASPTSEMDIFQACPYVEHVALPSAALRALYMSCRAAGLGEHDKSEAAFPSSVRQITLITHTQRYEWHFLDDLRAPNNTLFLHNITHLHMLDMQISAYVPHARLPNLTHLALPYLDLGANISQDLLRLPDGTLEHPSLRVIVLTVNESKYLNNPWYFVPRFSGTGSMRTNHNSPRESFRMLLMQARKKDDRVHVILSPCTGRTACEEWEAAARGGESIWEKAQRVMRDDSYGMQLPALYHVRNHS